jgi:hypothetical protein
MIIKYLKSPDFSEDVSTVILIEYIEFCKIIL